MPTAPKTYEILINEGKSHRTKSELIRRKKQEEDLLSGAHLKERPEVRGDPIAHKEFMRLNKILITIKKNDAIYEPIINRYCILQSECAGMESMKELVSGQLGQLKIYYYENKDTIDFFDFIDKQDKLAKQLISIDKQIQTKRTMLLNIEKENIMTIAAALRTIPPTDKKKKNALAEALNGN